MTIRLHTGRRLNIWHDAICTQLRSADGPLTTKQIWQGIASSGLRHSSKNPRGTLGGRLRELVQMQKIERVGPATYQLATKESMS